MATEPDRPRDPHGLAAPPSTPWLEWLAAGIGLVVALGTIGSIGWEALRGHDDLPAVAVQVERTVATATGHTVEIRAVNRGGATAAQVRVEGTLKRGAETVETAETVFDFVPGRSERKGGLFFRQDPRSLTLEVSAKGYAEP